MLELFSKSDAQRPSWGERLREALARTRERIATLLAGPTDTALLEQLETALIASDVGVETTQYLIAELRRRAPAAPSGEQLKEELKRTLLELLAPLETTLDCTRAKPFVILITGVNGAGKTTSIGKLAHHFRAQGRSVLLAAADTFRAAAREQLLAWAQRNDVAAVAPAQGDPGAIVYDAVQAASARSIDIVLADTAGRLPTQSHLMEEAKKIKRVLAKAQPGAPHETWLILDANTGQNALQQVRAFDSALGLTGLVLAKLDGTARGGAICAIAYAQARGTIAHGIPLHFIGVGESMDDLRAFSAREFVAALLD